MQYRKIKILDTSVILHNWSVLVEEGVHVIPQCALDEIEEFQNDNGDVGDNARSASNWISEMLNEYEGNEGITIGNTTTIVWVDNHEKGHDAKIIQTAHEVSSSKLFFNDDVVILTKSIALRAKARNSNILSEDYDDVGLVDTIDGWRFMEITEEEMEYLLSSQDTVYDLPNHNDLAINEYAMCTMNDEMCGSMIYRHIGGGRYIKCDRKPHMCGIIPKNIEQIMLANSLLDPSIPLVSSIGNAGSGKTILAIASAIQQVLCKHNYKKIIITRPIIPVGKDIGYLPGTVNEKMEEWVRPFMDNIEYIKSINSDKGKAKVASSKIDMLLNLDECKDIMEVLPITYIRGSSISDAFIIVDEAQNATPSEMKTIITRVGEGSKLVLMGDISQIDNRFLSRECNGLTLAVKKFWNHDLYSHITMKTVERSPLAELAAQVLF